MAGPIPISSIDPQDISYVPGTPLQTEYGGLGQQALTFGEGALGNIGGGWLENWSGIPELNPQARQLRQAANPITHFLGSMAGGAAAIAATGGLAAPVEGALTAEGAMMAKGLGPLAARTIGWGLEGGAFGAANAINDISLGDYNLNAQKIVSDIGFGALTGGALGALSKGIELMPALKWFGGEKPVEGQVPHGDMAQPSGPMPGQPIPDETFTQPPTPEPVPAPPQDVEGLKEYTKKGEAMGISKEYPQAQAVRGAANVLGPDLEFPILPGQINTVAYGPGNKSQWALQKETIGEIGQAARDYENFQKYNTNSVTDRYIQNVAPDTELITKPAEADNYTNDIFKKQYDAEHAALGPLFKKIGTIAESATGNHVPGIVQAITDQVPDAAYMFRFEDGELNLRPYSPGKGLAKDAYGAIKTLVEDLRGENNTLENVWNNKQLIDQDLREMAGKESEGKTMAQIGGIKSALLKYLDENVNRIAESNPSEEAVNLRSAFTRNAINEENRRVFENEFGAVIGSPKFANSPNVSAIGINNAIFKNINTVEAARSILGKEKFNEILANFLAVNREAATKDGAFKAGEWYRFLNKKSDVLRSALADNPVVLQKLQAANTIARLIPDAKSINPPHTAATGMAMAKMLGLLKTIPVAGEPLAKGAEMMAEKAAEKASTQAFNNELAGKANKASAVNQAKSIIQRTTDKIQSGAKSIFNQKAPMVPMMGEKTEEAYRKNSKRVKQLGQNPQAMLDHMQNNSQSLYAAMPNITQGVYNTLTKGVGFLNSKIPQPQAQYTLDPEFQPSTSQMAKFNNYYNAVNDPVGVLKHVKQGTLSTDSLEALEAVHPHLLNEMKMEVMGHINPEKIKDMSYPTKIALTKFIGHPLDGSLAPQSIMGNQANFVQNRAMSQQASQTKSTQSGLSKLKLSSRSATETRKSEAET